MSTCTTCSTPPSQAWTISYLNYNTGGCGCNSTTYAFTKIPSCEAVCDSCTVTAQMVEDMSLEVDVEILCLMTAAIENSKKLDTYKAYQCEVKAKRLDLIRNALVNCPSQWCEMYDLIQKELPAC